MANEVKSLNGMPLCDSTARESIENVKDSFQPKGEYLTEHQKIKTINGQSLIGEGDISIVGDNNPKVVDLCLFAGQSNMGGRGVASEATVCPTGHGYEFRAITDPTKLYDIIEPFGKNENNSASGVTESAKSGSLVSAYAENYYSVMKVPIVGVSCSKGGTSLEFWNVDGKPFADMMNRFTLALNWLNDNGYTVRHKFMVWLQGETDAGLLRTKEEYMADLTTIFNKMKEGGLEKCVIIRLGNAASNPARHVEIIAAQTELTQTNDDFIMGSTKLATMQNMMKDEYHFNQTALNIVGKESGINTAFYFNNHIKPCMDDFYYNTIYFPYNIKVGGSDIEVDATLKVEGMAADAKAVGDRLTALEAFHIDADKLFNVAIPEVQEGYSLVVDKTVAKKDDIVTLTLTPDESFECEMVVTDGVGNTVETTDDGNSHTFIMPYSDVTVTVTAESKIIEYKFDNPVENGTNFEEAGTLSDGVLTVAKGTGVKLQKEIEFRNDESWTIEAVIFPSDASTSAILVGSGATSGGFIQVPTPKGGGAFRFRDLGRTMDIAVSNIAAYTEPTHFAVVYDAAAQTFKLYINYVEQSATYGTGNAATFKSFTATTLFYSPSHTSMAYVGAINYLRFSKGSALTVDSFHRE